MSDPLRHDTQHPPQGETVIDRDARIEELLLIGLDHYFAARYEQAIHVWTRVLFLDRGHARARAYIERARSAQAERQRESDELFHTGVAAFTRGEAGVARDLLTSALERGASGDDTLAVLERIDRLETAGGQSEPRSSPDRSRPVRQPAAPRQARPEPRRGRRTGWLLARGAMLIAAGWLLSAGAPWHRGIPSAPTAPVPSAVAPLDRPLPVLPVSEAALARGRGLYDRGRLHEALRALDAVKPGDPLKAEADLLRASIQRTLLSSAAGTQPPVPGPDRP